LFVNELVPLRFGEVFRAFLVSRWLSLQFVSVLPSMIVERFLDGLWLATGIGIAAIAVPLPPSAERGIQSRLS
jgi:Lysylphosphatidylglycerol synthase TM region